MSTLPESAQKPKGPEHIAGKDVDKIVFFGDYYCADTITIVLKNGDYIDIKSDLQLRGNNLTATNRLLRHYHIPAKEEIQCQTTTK